MLELFYRFGSARIQPSGHPFAHRLNYHRQQRHPERHQQKLIIHSFSMPILPKTSDRIVPDKVQLYLNLRKNAA